MRATGLVVLVLLALACGGCEQLGLAGDEGANKSEEQASLIGSWSALEPVEREEDGLRMRMTDMRTTYFADNKSNFSARMTISGQAGGEPLPPGGVSFRVRGDATWARQGNIVRESTQNVSITPEGSDPNLAQFAAVLEQDMERQPSSNSEILELTATRLRTRDSDTGMILTFGR